MAANAFTIGEQTAWYLSRSSAVVAYLLLSGSMIWGLALSTKIVRDLVSPALALAMHSSLTWIAVGMAAFHAVVLLFDGYYQYTVADLLVPFAGPYRPQVVGFGIVSLYGLFLVTASFAARKWLGQRAWRRLHYLAFAFYVLVTAHGLLAGTDSSQSSVQAMYIGSVLAVLFLTNYRLLTGVKAPQPTAARQHGPEQPVFVASTAANVTRAKPSPHQSPASKRPSTHRL